MSETAIDQSVLDQEWLDHPPKVEEWAVKKADADHAVKQAEDRLSLAKAQVRLRVRKYPSKYGLGDKATTDDVAAAVVCSEKFQAAQAALREAEKLAGHCKAMMEGFDHRRTAMSKTVELWQMDFRSPPRSTAREVRKGMKKRRHAE